MHPEQSRVLTQEEVAERLRSSVRKLQRQRRDGGGPPFFRHAGRPLYRESSFERWLAEQEVSSTSAETVAKAKRRTAPADVQRAEAV